MTQPLEYQRARFDILRDTGYGVGVHYTSQTLSRSGNPRPFPEAAAAFNVSRFVEQVLETGAGHVLFTANHIHHRMACPHPEVDRILTGFTCERDLIMELADALEKEGVRLMLYYNHGICNVEPDWERAAGARDQDKTRYYENWKRIVGWMGEHYGEKVIAWWIDGAAIYRKWGNPPWREMTAAAKAGCPGRLVCYNNALECVASLTPYEDYWAGEIARINYVPRGATTPAGLPWYSYLDWHTHHDCMWAGVWGLWRPEWLAADWPAPSAETVADFYLRFRNLGGTVTYNLLIDQEGGIVREDLDVMRKVRRMLSGT